MNFTDAQLDEMANNVTDEIIADAKKEAKAESIDEHRDRINHYKAELRAKIHPRIVKEFPL